MTEARPTITATVSCPPFAWCLVTSVDVRAVWSNFEIGDLDFWRGEAYSKFFDFLDEQGGFYYEVRTPYIDRSDQRG